jgi:galactokinase
MAFAKANHIALKPFEIVKIASEAEREYIGLSNGLLDQSCIVLGKKNGLLFLDCDHNYECGSPELISIYEIMRPLKGGYGGRFSGAGFKGAVIALVDPMEKAHVEEVLTQQYLERFPEYETTFKVYWVKPDDGARFV